MKIKLCLHTIYLCILLLAVGVQQPAHSSIPTTLKSAPSQDSLNIDKSSAIDIKTFNSLNETYKGEEFNYNRSVDQKGWWLRFKEWLSNFIKRLFNLTDEGQASRATDIALKTGGIVTFILVIYFIFKAVINKEGQWVFGKLSDKNILPVTEIENNIQTTNFKDLIIAAEKKGKFRLAVRYYYQWILKSLAHTNRITYDIEKTNSDYYNEITSIPIKKEFSYTSYLYNYIWYGEFDVTQEEFNKAKQSFTRFLNTLNQ